MRAVYVPGLSSCAGYTRKYVGETAHTMGSDPAWTAYPTAACESAAVFTSYGAARDYLIRLHTRFLAGLVKS